jgi:hypothetical protein
MKRSFRRFPTFRTWCVDRLGFGQCLGADEAEARENPSRLAAQMFIQPQTKPDVRQQL